MRTMLYIKNNENPAGRNRRKAFTLVELLAVIGLITLIAGAFGYALLTIGAGSVEGAQRLAAGVFSTARQQAVLRGRETRVIIHADPADPDRYLRQLGVIFNSADPGEPPTWVAAGQGEVLPGGIYFVPQVARNNGSSPPETMNLRFPSTEPQSGEGGDMYFFFEYSKQGHFTEPGAQFVLEPGRLEPSSDRFSVVPEVADGAGREQTWGGFLLLRLGGLLVFPEPEAIQR